MVTTIFTWTLNAQVDTIITATGELGNPESNLDFLDETGRLTRFPRLTDVGELLYYPPIVTTDSVTNITHSSAIVYGNILFNGWCESVLEQGFQISTTADFSESVTSHQVTPSYFDCEFPCLENVFFVSCTGLLPGSTYYVRAYATNSVGTAYGEEVTFTTSSEYEEWDGEGRNPNDTKPCQEAITVKDYDNNSYNTVIIGNQCWMKENLRTTKYDNGTSIPKKTSGYQQKFYFIPSNADNNGFLYNSYAATNTTSWSSVTEKIQGICPSGWHLPTYNEFREMFNYLSNNGLQCDESIASSVGKAIAANSAEWLSSTNACAIGNNFSANNSSQFSAYPAGWYNYNPSGYESYQTNAYFWMSGNKLTQALRLSYDSPGYGLNGFAENVAAGTGCSVRCLRDYTLPSVSTSPVGDITSTNATGGGVITDDGGAPVTGRGVCWSTSHNPTIEDNKTNDGTGTGSFTSSLTGLTGGTTYYVRAYATNNVETAYGEEVNFTTTNTFTCGTSTIKDVDNNTYNTVQIGNQCWMKQNLRTTKYADGTSIPVSSSASSQTAYRYNPNKNAANVATYGCLYNWKAVMRNSSSSSASPSGVQGVCPTGWHVPSDSEWTQLTNYVSGQSQYKCNSSNNNIAKALASTTGWKTNSNTCAVGNTQSNNNATGFSAAPAGGYYGGDVGTGNFGYSADFWSATASNGTNAYRRVLLNSNALVSTTNSDKKYGCSVRCIKN